MVWQWIACVLIGIGAGVWLFIYHVRTKQIVLEHRTQVVDWPVYTWIDLYLKISTLIITFTAILADGPWLIELHDDPFITFAGLGIAGGGIVVFVWAIGSLDQQFSEAHQARLPTELVASGPYRWIRHPIYTANLVLSIGLFVACGSVWGHL